MSTLRAVIAVVFAIELIGDTGWCHKDRAPTTLPATQPVGAAIDITKIVTEMRVPIDEHAEVLFPDVDYFMRAKVTPQQWQQIENTIKGSWKRSEPGTIWRPWDWPYEDGPVSKQKPEWWRPKPEPGVTYLIGQKVVKYEDGYLYYRDTH